MLINNILAIVYSMWLVVALGDRFYYTHGIFPGKKLNFSDTSAITNDLPEACIINGNNRHNKIPVPMVTLHLPQALQLIFRRRVQFTSVVSFQRHKLLNKTITDDQMLTLYNEIRSGSWRPGACWHEIIEWSNIDSSAITL